MEEYNKWLKNKLYDMRNKEYCQWFKETHFMAIYNEYDEFITTIENIDTLPNVLNIPMKELFRIERENRYIMINGKKYKIYFFKKDEDLYNHLERKRRF